MPRHERLVSLARFPWILRYTSWLVLACIGAGPQLWFFLHLYEGSARVVHGAVAMPITLVGIAIFLGVQIYIMTTEFAVTDQRIVFKRGIISRETNELPLAAIENVNLNQTIFARIFGYGYLEINGSGGSPLRTPPMQDPVSFRGVIAEARVALEDPPHYSAKAETIDEAHNRDHAH